MLMLLGGLAAIIFLFSPAGRLITGGALILLGESFIGIFVIWMILKSIGK